MSQTTTISATLPHAADPASALEHVTSLDWTPLLPVWLLLALGALSAVALGVAFVRRASGASWRLLGFALVMLWLAGPRLVQASWQDLPETALLVVDQTGSMSVGHRSAIAEQAATGLREAGRRLGDLTVRTVTVSDSPAGGTRLFDAIAHAASDIPAGQLAGVLAITDGQVHDTPDALPDRLAPGGRNPAPVPFHVLIPAAGEQTDRRLRILQAPPFAVIGHDATIRVEIEDLAPLASPPGTHATLTLLRGGEPPISRDVPVGIAQDITVPITQPGPMLITLQAQTLPGEVSTLNNQAVVQINGVRDRLRVLLVSGTPNQGERVWRRLLKADPSVDLVHFTILRPPDKDDTTPLNELALIAFPTRELFQEKINSFDLIILDGFENRGILPIGYLENIADFVRGGGGLLLTAGPEFIGRNSLQDTPLADILPVHVPEEGGLLEEKFQARPTELGRRHPVTADLPQMPLPDKAAGAPPDNPGLPPSGWGPWYRALRADQAHGEVLLTAPDNAGNPSPLLVLDHVEHGRVAVLLSDQIWLWSRGEGGGGPQAELLRRAAHWLMKEPELEEEQLSAAISHGEISVRRRSVEESPARHVSVTQPDGSVTGLELARKEDGTLSGSMAAHDPGIWEVSDGSRHAYAASVPGDPLEIADLRASAAILAPVARRTEGSIHWLGSDPAALRLPSLRMVGAHATASGNGWIGLRRTGAHVVTGTESRPLLPAWLMLPLLLLVLFIGWRREGRR